MRKNIMSLVLAAVFILTIAGCSSNPTNNIPAPSPSSDAEGGNSADTVATELELRFGESDAFVVHLYDNDTAAAIAEYVGTADWQLPIYHFDDYDNWEVMQYYDVPSRYEMS